MVADSVPAGEKAFCFRKDPAPYHANFSANIKVKCDGKNVSGS